MTFFEKTGNPQRLRHWVGDAEADYIYTSGVAGDRFFKELKRSGKIMGTWCDKCGQLLVPPRMFCESCMEKLTEWREVPSKGKVEAFSIAYVNRKGERLEKPVVWAFISMQGAKGGFIHKLDVPPEEARIGLTVEPVLKKPEEREGAITDIVHFRKVEE